MRAAILLFVLALLPGCASLVVDVPPDEGDVADAALPLVFTAPVDILGGGRGYEPSIDVAPDGTLVVTAARSPGDQAAGLASWLRYSQDAGATWRDVPSPARLHALLPAAEGEIAIDAASRLYFVDTYLADNAISRWQLSAGEPQWESTLPTHGTPWVDDRPWLAAHGDGIVYYIGNNAGTNDGVVLEGGMVFYRSTDAGRTWTLGDAFYFTSWCNLAASPVDDITMLAACYRPDDENVVAFLSADRGATFDEAVAGPLEAVGGNFPAAAFDAAGNPYAAWISGLYTNDEPDRLFLSRVRDGEWAPLDLTPFEGSLGFVALAAGAPGTVAVLYYAAEDAPPTADTVWTGRVLLTTNALDETPTWRDAAFDPEPVAVGVEPNGDFFQAVFAPDGTLHVAYARQDAPRTGVFATDRITDQILHVALPP